MTTRDKAARLLRQVRARGYPLSPWDICVVAAARLDRKSAEYIHIKGVAVKFKPTANSVITRRLSR